MGYIWQIKCFTNKDHGGKKDYADIFHQIRKTKGSSWDCILTPNLQSWITLEWVEQKRRG